jgi:hypothetical protein
MSSATMDIEAVFVKKIDFAPPSTTMRELMAAEAERWRQMEEDAEAKKQMANRRGFLAMFGRH